MGSFQGPLYPARIENISLKICFMPIQAVQHVRKMRGGAQSHLMRASDGHYYVVKFQNNPQHLRVLANELLVARRGKVRELITAFRNSSRQPFPAWADAKYMVVQ
jgi:hypothetical protein